MKSIICILVLSTFVAVTTPAQEDMSRMDRDIEVAENVLQTLIRQQFTAERTFFPLDIEGSYQPGYGVTFRFPANYTTPLTITLGGNRIVLDGDDVSGKMEMIEKRLDRVRVEIDDEIRLKGPGKPMHHRFNLDSLQNVYNEKVVEAARIFMMDYHELLSQLPSNEKIVVTNRGEQPRVWVSRFMTSPQRTLLEVEALKSDLNQYKSGKLTREQMLNRITVVSTQTTEATEPDLELLASILNRLYRSDLSKTYFIEGNVYYERLKNFGVVYYLKVYSSNQRGDTYDMPTIKMENLDQAARDKKVKELYPQFEKELKENMLEYGRTLKSLADDEQLVINVKLTRCTGCGIPASLELLLRGNILKDYASGKITKEAALGKITVKKGPQQ